MFRWLGVMCAVVLAAGGWGESFAEGARARRGVLSLSTYVTVETAHKMATDPAVQAEALAALEANGITKIYFETARGGPALPREEMFTLRDFYSAKGYAVAAGLATHPSQPGFGTRADRGLIWFNYQSPATAEAIAGNVRDTAAVFDELILDDFFCSGDESAESNAARGSREWGTYRRDLLCGFARANVIEVAKAVNPRCTTIIKFPQWYDLFDLYGYDPEREPQIFDRVFVGTESRGAHTKRFGFTQPYEGFVNYRWLAACSGGKAGGAWFDFVDSTPEEYVSHAWMSVLAGAKELVLFSFPSLLAKDPGLDCLRRDFPRLAELAQVVAEHPAIGVAAYKPPNAPAVNDIYLLDHLGMLGIPLAPVNTFPGDAPVVLLPTQAAGDTALLEKVLAAVKPGKTFVFTAGLLAAAPEGEGLARLAGVKCPRPLEPLSAQAVRVPGGDLPVPRGLDLGGRLALAGARVVLSAVVDGEAIPLLTEYEKDYCRYLVLNLRGYGKADFEATGEYLLSPRELGVLDLPQPACDILRRNIAGVFVGDLSLPPRVTVHDLGPAGLVVKNYSGSVVEASGPRLDLGEITSCKAIQKDKKQRKTMQINVDEAVWMRGIEHISGDK